MSSFEFLSLPDDALLEVLGHLQPRELFACRTLCRRLRDICLHRDLWKKVEVRDENRGLLRAILALAPCLGHVDRSPKDLASLVSMTNTACVVNSLALHLKTKRDVTRAISVLLHLSSVGGVRKLFVEWNWFHNVKAVTHFAKTIYSLHGLEDLDFSNPNEESELGTLCDLQVQVTPTLKKLSYYGEKMDPFAELLLKTHADTLQEVGLFFIGIPVPLLVTLPKVFGLLGT